MRCNTYAWVHRELTHDGQDFAWPYEQPSWIVTHRDLGARKGGGQGGVQAGGARARRMRMLWDHATAFSMRYRCL